MDLKQLEEDTKERQIKIDKIFAKLNMYYPRVKFGITSARESTADNIGNEITLINEVKITWSIDSNNIDW